MHIRIIIDKLPSTMRPHVYKYLYGLFQVLGTLNEIGRAPDESNESLELNFNTHSTSN